MHDDELNILNDRVYQHHPSRMSYTFKGDETERTHFCAVGFKNHLCSASHMCRAFCFKLKRLPFRTAQRSGRTGFCVVNDSMTRDKSKKS